MSWGPGGTCENAWEGSGCQGSASGLLAVLLVHFPARGSDSKALLTSWGLRPGGRFLRTQH